MTTTLSESALPQALRGGDAKGALALFDSLPAVASAEIHGRWRGREVPTGHPLDGLLGASGWYGKEFLDDEAVHPLLFRSPGGDIFPVEPRLVPLSLLGFVPTAAASAARRLLDVIPPAVRARAPRARLREVRHRGTVTAAMVYDHLPIIDVFRRLDDDSLLGVMDLRDMDDPYFFLLERP